jgi:hypothetical protein
MNTRIHADTLSVLTEGSTSIHCYLRIGAQQDDMENSCNLSVRFDQGDAATICGYPQPWIVHDVPIDQFDSASIRGEEYMLDFLDLDDLREQTPFTQYVSRETEIKLLNAVIKGIKRQAANDMFKDHASDQYRAECIGKLKLAIKRLKQSVPVEDAA